jgi:hypothetical protein
LAEADPASQMPVRCCRLNILSPGVLENLDRTFDPAHLEKRVAQLPERWQLQLPDRNPLPLSDRLAPVTGKVK